MTMRELLAENHIDLDWELVEGELRWTREPVERPSVGGMRTRLPGPVVDVDIHITIKAADVP